MSRSAKSLVGYCGLYCGACGIHQGRIRQAVENLRKVIGVYGFDKMGSQLAKWEPAFQHYEEFEKVLDGFVSLLGDCPGCVAGGGDPSCTLRECCKEKGYTTCAECEELDSCEKAKRIAESLDELHRIRAMGVDEWADGMQKKVEAGYCYLDNEIK